MDGRRISIILGKCLLHFFNDFLSDLSGSGIVQINLSHCKRSNLKYFAKLLFLKLISFRIKDFKIGFTANFVVLGLGLEWWLMACCGLRVAGCGFLVAGLRVGG